MLNAVVESLESRAGDCLTCKHETLSSTSEPMWKQKSNKMKKQTIKKAWQPTCTTQPFRGKNGGGSLELQINVIVCIIKQDTVLIRKDTLLLLHTCTTHIFMWKHTHREKLEKCMCVSVLKSCEQDLSVNQVYFCRRFVSRLNYFRAIGSHEHQRDMVNSFPSTQKGTRVDFPNGHLQSLH